jgi:hypothetical protein
MARPDRPAGIRWCGKCNSDADHGAGQSSCKACRAAVARTARAEFSGGVEALKRVLGTP